MQSISSCSVLGRRVLQSQRALASTVFNQERNATTVIMGPPGGGKGTISKKLIKDFGYNHLSTGDILRAQVREGTPIGLEAKTYMESGQLVPDKVIIDMVVAEIKAKSSESDMILLDGFPRTAAQAAVLDENVTIDIALSIEVPTEDIVARISSRWTHLASGRVYAYDYNPPKVEGKDDDTGEPLIQREDDKPESVRVRLQAFADTVQPLLDHYSNKGVLNTYDGSDHPDLVAADKRTDAIYKSLKPFLEKKHAELKK